MHSRNARCKIAGLCFRQSFKYKGILDEVREVFLQQIERTENIVTTAKLTSGQRFEIYGR